MVNKIEFDEVKVETLPYKGPLSRRLYVVDCYEPKSRELFIQRNDAFTTNLVNLLIELKAGNIVQVYYSTGLDGMIRIYLNENRVLRGEFTCKMQKTLEDFKSKMGLS